MCIFPKRFLPLSNYISALFLHSLEKVKWNKHFFQFTVPEKKWKKKNAKVKFVGNGNQSEEKIDAEPQSLKARHFSVMDQIKSPQNMSQKQVEYDIPLFHFWTILTKVTFRFIIAKQSYESKKIKKRPFQLFCNPEKSY